MIAADVEFLRKYLYSMGERYSKFRGKGHISFDGDAIVVTGKRIYPPMILLSIFTPFALITFVLIYKISYLFWILYAVLLFSYYTLQSIFLKEEVLALSWPQIMKYELDAQKRMIAFDTENNSKCSPLVFTTENFDEIANLFRDKIRNSMRTSHGWKAVEQRNADQINSMGKSIDRWFEGKQR